MIVFFVKRLLMSLVVVLVSTLVMYVVVDAAIDPLMTGSELVHLQAVLHGIPTKVADQRGKDLLERVGLTAAADRRRQGSDGGRGGAGRRDGVLGLESLLCEEPAGDRGDQQEDCRQRVTAPQRQHTAATRDRLKSNASIAQTTPANAVKTYTCPGCLQAITPATPHVVVWPVEKPLLSADVIDERRHWHTACWQARDRRR